MAHMISYLVSEGADVNAVEGEFSYSPLTLAAVMSHSWACLELINAGAEVFLSPSPSLSLSPTNSSLSFALSLSTIAEKGLTIVLEAIVDREKEKARECVQQRHNQREIESEGERERQKEIRLAEREAVKRVLNAITDPTRPLRMIHVCIHFNQYAFFLSLLAMREREREREIEFDEIERERETVLDINLLSLSPSPSLSPFFTAVEYGRPDFALSLLKLDDLDLYSDLSNVDDKYAMLVLSFVTYYAFICNMYCLSLSLSLSLSIYPSIYLSLFFFQQQIIHHRTRLG
jgi:hypothetical protein